MKVFFFFFGTSMPVNLNQYRGIMGILTVVSYLKVNKDSGPTTLCDNQVTLDRELTALQSFLKQ